MDPAHKAREVGKTTVICVQKLDAFTLPESVAIHRTLAIMFKVLTIGMYLYE